MPHRRRRFAPLLQRAQADVGAHMSGSLKLLCCAACSCRRGCRVLLVVAALEGDKLGQARVKAWAWRVGFDRYPELHEHLRGLGE